MTNHLGTASIIRANSRDLPLPDDSVDLVVTSPPYFALRSYQDGGEHYQGQIGDEPTPAEFVASLLEVTRECMRVLKPSGSIWVNLGDKYSGAGRGNNDSDKLNNTAAMRSSRLKGSNGRQHVGKGIIPAKSLMGIPWRYALACIDDLGLILRAEVIWSKPNGLPESVTDRVRRSHEQWFHFTLNPRYYSAVDNIREPITDTSAHAASRRERGDARLDLAKAGMTSAANPVGKLPGSVWTIPTQPLRVPDHLGIDHFAAFPMEFPRRVIQGWSPAGVCTACGEGRRPVSDRATVFDKARDQAHATEIALRGAAHGVMSGGTAHSTLNGVTTRTITGDVCACTPSHTEVTEGRERTVYDWHLWEPAPTTPGVILDVFGGTGTTALVAKALGRHGITVDMSADYCRLAGWRTTDPDQIAAAMQVDKPARQIDGQADLFALLVDEPR